MIPPASAVNYVPWGIVGFIFQYVIRRRHFSWWAKYNYVLSAALDSGVAIAAVVIFFTLQYPKNGEIGATNIQAWWGNKYVPFRKPSVRSYFSLIACMPKRLMLSVLLCSKFLPIRISGEQFPFIFILPFNKLTTNAAFLPDPTLGNNYECSYSI